MTHSFVPLYFSVPGGSPVSLQTNPTSSITVTLVWNDLPYSQRNGVIVRYSVEVCQIEPHGSCKTSPTNGNQTSLVISSLHPYYEYNWRVAANTSVGRGPYSSYTSFVMPEDGEYYVANSDFMDHENIYR